MPKLVNKNDIEDFSCDNGDIWLQFADGSEDYIDQSRFERWLVNDRPNYLELGHGRTASNYRDVCLDVEGFYRSANACKVLGEYLEVPNVILLNKYNHFQNSSL